MAGGCFYNKPITYIGEHAGIRIWNLPIPYRSNVYPNWLTAIVVYCSVPFFKFNVYLSPMLKLFRLTTLCSIIEIDRWCADTGIYGLLIWNHAGAGLIKSAIRSLTK